MQLRLRGPVALRSALAIAILAAPLAAPAQGSNATNLWVVDLHWSGTSVHVGQPAKLTADNGTNSQPSFAPDGRSIIFSGTRDTGSAARSDIYRIDLSTRRETRVTRTAENENSPVQLQNGEYVAVRWQPATLFREFGPWVYAANGTPLRAVLPGPDTTGYYTPLSNGNYILTRPKSRGFTIALFDSAAATITDLDSGVPALPAQRIPGQNAISYIKLDSLDGRHTIQRLDLGTREITSLGPTVIGRTAHAWVPGRNAILMAKGNALYLRAPNESAWRQVATFAQPDLRSVNAYVASPQGDKLILVSQQRPTLAALMRDSLDAGLTGPQLERLVQTMQETNSLSRYDVTEGSIATLGDDRLARGRAAHAAAIHRAAASLFPRSWRAFDRLGDAERAAGNPSAAATAWTRALELNPRSTEVERTAALAIEQKIQRGT